MTYLKSGRDFSNIEQTIKKYDNFPTNKGNISGLLSFDDGGSSGPDEIAIEL